MTRDGVPHLWTYLPGPQVVNGGGGVVRVGGAVY